MSNIDSSHNSPVASIFALAEAAQSLLAARRMLSCEANAQTHIAGSRLAALLDYHVTLLDGALAEVHQTALGLDCTDEDATAAIDRVERCARLAAW